MDPYQTQGAPINLNGWEVINLIVFEHLTRAREIGDIVVTPWIKSPFFYKRMNVFILAGWAPSPPGPALLAGGAFGPPSPPPEFL